ncbi:MAG: haloacid dehalogenase-like hydrolase [Lachnospiraceae bacterium]|nr:haloacid dehalogenase-like hydrolase [Lachnospiraceae bacterium]
MNKLKKLNVLLRAMLVAFVCAAFTVTVYAEPETQAAENEAAEAEAVEAEAEEASGEVLEEAPAVLPLSEYWAADSSVAESLRSYVEKVTNEDDKTNFIPVRDRIAVFDMDGTLTCETFFTYYDTMMYIDYCNNYLDRNTFLSEKDKAELKEVAKSITPDYKAGEALARSFAMAYTGMTVDELYDFAVEFGQKETASFNNMRYIDGFYLPMVELVKYLYDNDFTIYVISGTERTTSRAIVGNSPIRDYVTPAHVIGTEFEIKLEGHEKTPSNMDYKYGEGGKDEKPVVTGGFVQKNLNANKTLFIEREIGQRPVLAFGNSGSDTSMLNYALINNQYPSEAYMVVADDTEREWGPQNWAEKSEEYAAQGYIPVSMKDDFGQIYPEGITKAETQYQEPGAEAVLDYAKTFPSWNPDSASLKELVDFVGDCTDEASTGYLEPADRIATFDMDGTILCEKAPVYVDYCLSMHRVLDDPTYAATEEERDAMQQIRDYAYSGGETYHPETLAKDDMIASAFAGMTPEEFRAYVVDFADTVNVVGFDGMTYGESFYKPMIEVINYLRANDFDVYMVSACEREVVRAMVERFDFPYDHVIATDVPYIASGKGEEASDEYNMAQDEQIVLGEPLEEVECGKSGKSAAIAREIGKRPVLAFGNSSGDYSMLNYAEGNPEHEGMGFFVVCDDTEREYGSDEKAAEYYDKVEKESWTAISMADDWATIYGEGVEKTELPGAEEALDEAA